MSDATPINVGNGPSIFLTPDYAPVQGTCGTDPNGWTFGGGGNYPRPFTSFTQRVVEASNILGPFAIRIGDAESVGDGRMVIDSEGLAFREQRWYTQNDGFTGYPSKAEWWHGCIKYVIRAVDLHAPGHPIGLFEVAITNPVETEIFNYPFNPFNFMGSIFGALPPILGTITGAPSFPLYPFLGGPGPLAGPGSGPGGNNGNPTIPNIPNIPNWLMSGGTVFGDIVNTADSLVDQAIQTLGENLSGLANEVADWHNDLTGSGGGGGGGGGGEETFEMSNWFSNFLNGVMDGQTCMNGHVAHNVTPPDGNGSFDDVPGETKSNPRACILNDFGQQNLSSILGSGALLPNNTGGSNGIDSNARTQMGDQFSNFINLGTANYAQHSNGRGMGAWLIFGRTIFNEANQPGNSAAAQNPTIDSNGNLHIYDTYDFSVSNASGLVDNMRPFIGNDAADAIDSILDTMPGFYATPGLSAAGKTRQLNSGGTPNDVPLSGVSQLQNTYQDVVITPQNLNIGNPTLYNTLKENGYFDHVDPSKLP